MSNLQPNPILRQHIGCWLTRTAIGDQAGQEWQDIKIFSYLLHGSQWDFSDLFYLI